MAKIATAEQTSGSGFDYEDKVSAYFLANMLAGLPPLTTELGLLQKVQYQVRQHGWLFDDLLLSFLDGKSGHRVAVSAKSNRQITNSGFPVEILKDIWDQYLGVNQKVFDGDNDYMLFVVAPLARSVSQNLAKLIHSARVSKPEDMVASLNTPAFSVQQRSLFQSLSCPPHWKADFSLTDEDICRLLKRIIVKEFDFRATDSNDINNIYHILQECLVSKRPDEASQLFEKLCGLRAKAAQYGGFYDYTVLVGQINTQFKLTAFPQHQVDWEKIARTVKGKIENIPDKIGNTLHLDRTQELERLTDQLTKTPLVFLIGNSGAGKTVLAKTMVEAAVHNGSQALWIDPEVLQHGSLETYYHLEHAVADLILKCRTSGNLLVIDGADRIFKQEVFDPLVTLLRNVINQPLAAWQVIITCQQDSYEDLVKKLYRKNLVIPQSEVVTIKNVSQDELLNIGHHFPRLVDLLRHDHLRGLLANLKFLDLVLFHISNFNPSEFTHGISETHLIDWIWQQDITDNGENGASNSRFLQELGEKQANELTLFTSVTNFRIEESGPINELKRNKIILERDDRISFLHDLYGDWARYKIIRANRDKIMEYLPAKDLFSPLWCKAIRLFGIYLLEKDNGPQEWLQVYQGFDLDDARGKLLQNLLLESVIYASDTEQYLEELWEELKKDEAKILNQFFEQFLFKATIPNVNILKLEGQLEGISVSQLATYYRIPKYSYWFPILKFAAAHLEELYELTRGYTIKISTIWLENMPIGGRFRDIAARIAFDNARYMYDFKKNGGYALDHSGKNFYKPMLLAVNELPDQIIDLSLKLCGRRIEEAEKEHDEEQHNRGIMTGYNPRRGTEFPDGPKISPDDDFEEACLEAPNFLPMIRYEARVAKEIVLALMIDAPQELNSFDRHDYHLDINDVHQWYPPFYNRGPFLGFLQNAPEEGLDMVIRLVNFATTNWKLYIEHTGKTAESVILEIPERGEAIFFGDSHTYYWFRDIGNIPDSLASVLMALEKFLMDCIDNKTDIQNYVNTILQKGNSLSFIGLLSSVGKYAPDLFSTSLKPLLFIFDFYEWENQLDFGGSIEGFQMTGASFFDRTTYSLAEKWHSLPHRRRSIKMVALSLLINYQEINKLFREQIIPKWQAFNDSIAKGNYIHPLLDNLIAQFNIDNYIPYADKEQTGIIYQEPATVTQKLAPVRADRSNDDFLFAFNREREIENGVNYDLGALEALWQQVQDFYKQPERNLFEHLNHRLANIFSGIAIIIRHKAILKEKHPEYFDWINKVTKEVLDRFIFNLRESTMIAGPADWEKFSAEYVPALFAENPDNKNFREFLGILILHSRNADIEHIFRELLKYYKVNDPIFVRIVNLYMLRCNLIHIQDYSHYDSLIDWQKVFAPVLKAFIENKTQARLINLAVFRPKKRKKKQDDPALFIRKRGRQLVHLHDCGLDLELLYQAFQFPTWDTIRSEAEKDYIVGCYKMLIDTLIFTWGQVTEQMDVLEISLSAFDQWLIFRLTHFLIEINDAEKAKLLWQPILSYGNIAGKWLEKFFNSLLFNNYQHPENYDALGVLWNNMINFAAIQPTWKYQNHFYSDHARLWETLLGISDIQVSIWQAGFPELLLKVKNKLIAWLTPRYMNTDAINKLAMIMRSASAPNFLDSGLQLIDVHLRFQFIAANTETPEGLVRIPFKYYDSVASTASYLWEHHRSGLLGDTAILQSYKSIVINLVAVQNHIGLELQDRIIEY